MRTRYICRVLCLVLCFSLFAQSVFAVEGGIGWSSFLDYGYGSERGNYLNFTSNGMFNYELPFTASVRSVQGLIQASGKAITSVSFGRSGSSTTYPCTLISLGNSLYKFYLTRTDLTMNSDEFQLYVTNDGSGNSVVRLLEFEYTETRSLLYAETGWYDLTWFNGSSNVNKTATMSNTSTPVSTYFGASGGQTTVSRSFNCFFSFSDWRNYDYLQFHIRVQADFLNSLSATIGDKPLPFEISYINSTSGTHLYGDIYSESIDIAEGTNSYYQTEGSFYFSEHNRNYFDITVTVDVRNCDPHSTVYPKIDIRGLQSLVENYNFIQLVYCCGIIEYEPVSPLYSFLGMFVNGFSENNEWLTKIYSQNVTDYESIRGWLSEINISISDFGSSIVERLDKLLERENTAESDQFDETLASQETVIDEMDAVLDSVTKPDIEDIDTSVEEFVPAEDVQEYTGILRIILGSSILGTMCLMSLTLGLVSYIIYGKKG